jgi:hypothetical protein
MLEPPSTTVTIADKIKENKDKACSVAREELATFLDEKNLNDTTR